MYFPDFLINGLHFQIKLLFRAFLARYILELNVVNSARKTNLEVRTTYRGGSTSHWTIWKNHYLRG